MPAASNSSSSSFSRFAHDAFDTTTFTVKSATTKESSKKKSSSYRTEEASEKPGCCLQFCRALKFICVVIAKVCYVMCPPVPELVTRKCAFFPPPKGLSYRLVAYNNLDRPVYLLNAGKVSQFTAVEIEVNKLWEGRMMPMDRAEMFFVKTSAGSLLPVVYARKRHNARNQHGTELVVIFSQPNGSDLGFFLQPMVYRSHPCNLRFLADKLHADVYAYDYSGYGMSTGHASEDNIYRDLEAVYEHVLKIRGPEIRVVLLGYSMGTAATVAVAARHPKNLCGVVLVAPFASAFRLLFGNEHGDGSCCLDRFLSYERAPLVNVPTLICHGMKDKVVPVEHGMVLHARFPRAVRPLFVPEGDHVSIFTCKFVTVIFRIFLFLQYQTDPLHPTGPSQLSSTAERDFSSVSAIK